MKKKTFNLQGDKEAKKVEDLRNRAWAFMLKLLEETEKRLPSNVAVFRQQAFFSPSTILGVNQKRFAEMPFRECVENDEDLAELEEQWRQVSQVANIFNHPKCKLVRWE
jgi:hypothetical protein